MGADAFYLFPEEFFARLERLGDALLVLDAGTAAGLFLTGGGAMHYFLTGSTLEARQVASANLLLFEAMRRARELRASRRSSWAAASTTTTRCTGSSGRSAPAGRPR